jgi:hypothetical protein
MTVASMSVPSTCHFRPRDSSEERLKDRKVPASSSTMAGTTAKYFAATQNIGTIRKMTPSTTSTDRSSDATITEMTRGITRRTALPTSTSSPRYACDVSTTSTALISE